ncbi:hypothetical protein HZC53_02665 [Candidatus Uhrbacteria bacterium]|nr:hypothetical protein [Candidatus Uhrbacteria bacterium]
MARLNLDHEHIRNQLFKLASLREDERHAVAELIIHLSDVDDWYPEALRRELHKLQSSGTISEADRHAVEKSFFPEHNW